MKTWRSVKCFTSPGVASQPPAVIDRNSTGKIQWSTQDAGVLVNEFAGVLSPRRSKQLRLVEYFIRR